MGLSTDNLLRKAWNRRYPTGIVSRRHRIIYYEVTKAASSSIRLLMAQLEGLSTDRGPAEVEFELVRHGDLKKYAGFDRFSVMRDPLDRLVSCYKDKIRGLLEASPSGHTGGLMPGLERYNRLPGVRLFYPEMSFEKFVRVVTRIPDSLAERHLRSQHRYFLDPRGRSLVDRLLRFEYLEEDLEAYFAHLGLPSAHLKHLRSTVPSSSQEYYTEQLERRVRRRYKKDLEIFGQLQ